MSGVVDGAPPVPIAGTLETEDLPARHAEWQDFFRSSVVTSEISPSAVRLLLEPSDGALLHAVSLGQREKQCCAFFDFAIMVEAAQRWLSVTVPVGTEETLTRFLTMLRSGTEPTSMDRSPIR
ncbi:MAG TPA: hypothetical protein VND70_05440 [Acidimicrobiales bacterium]|nr:hypothetical protein [Acidimicrobiales bacterium]